MCAVRIGWWFPDLQIFFILLCIWRCLLLKWTRLFCEPGKKQYTDTLYIIYTAHINNLPCIIQKKNICKSFIRTSSSGDAAAAPTRTRCVSKWFSAFFFFFQILWEHICVWRNHKMWCSANSIQIYNNKNNIIIILDARARPRTASGTDSARTQLPFDWARRCCCCRRRCIS